jgi:hypothetical protein
MWDQLIASIRAEWMTELAWWLRTRRDGMLWAARWPNRRGSEKSSRPGTTGSHVAIECARSGKRASL